MLSAVATEVSVQRAAAIRARIGIDANYLLVGHWAWFHRHARAGSDEYL